MTAQSSICTDNVHQIGRWRADTPGCAERVHLNNAGAALMPVTVVEAITAHTELEARTGGYEAANERSGAVAEVYGSLARLVNAAPLNIAITGSATDSFVRAASAFDFEPGDVIVTSRADYTSYQIQYLSLARRVGVRVVHAGDLPEGGIDPDDLRRILQSTPVRLVSVSWMPTHGGLIQDIHSVASVCEAAGVPLHIDACQAVGQLEIDTARLHCDYLSATARKFLRGPRGAGFLYVSDRALARGDYPLYVDMRGAEWVAPDDFRVAATARRFEDWEFAYSLVLGLGAAADYALAQGVAATGRRAMDLGEYLRQNLQSVDGVRLLDTGAERSAIVTFDHDRLSADDLARELAAEAVNTAVSRMWFGMIDFRSRGVDAAVRASPHYYNTVEELDLVVDIVRRAVAR